MLRFRPATATFLLAAALVACGGGGGGSGGGGATPPVGPALSFTPATVSASYAAGTSQTLNVIAAVARPTDFSGAAVFPVIVDSAGVLVPNMQLVRDSDSQYHAALQTSPTLAAGHYTGSFSIKLCKDANCAGQFPGSPVALPYDVTVTPAGSSAFSAVPAMPLTATAQNGAAPPPGVAVAITAGGNWTADTGGATWLKLSAASGSGNATLTVSYDATGLAAGTYTGNLTVSAGAGQSAVLPATLTVLPSGLVLGSNNITFNAVNGAPIATQVVSLDTDNKLSATWTASSSAAWLGISPTAGATPATTVLTVDPTVGKLASGSYSANITIVPAGLTTRTLPVTLNLTPATLLPSSASITLGGTYGRDFSTTQPLNLSLNTGTASWPWSLGGVPSWAAANVSSGTVSQTGAAIVLTPRPANAATGVTSSLMTASASVNGDTVTAPVLLTINKDQHKLLPAEVAVAMVSTPGWSRLTRTITVSDNFGSFGGMSASSDQSWLVAGVSGNKLVLTADPTPLLNGSLNTAAITITPTDPDASAPEVIRVALWKGADNPSANAVAALPYTTVVADPLRPYVYAHNGGAYIDVYNLYTGAREASITGFAAHLGDMAVGVNGDYLYVLDLDNSRVTKVSLASRAISAQLALTTAATKSTRIRLTHPNGVELLLLSDGQAYLNSPFRQLPALPLTTGGALSASADGKRLVQQSEGGGSVQHTTVSLDYSALNNGTLYAAKLAKSSHVSTGTQGQDVFVSSDGTRVYSATGSLQQCTVMNSDDLGILAYLAIGLASPNNVEVGIDGRIYCGGAASVGNSDIYVYDSTGATLLKQFKLSATGRQLLARQMAVSGDGWLLAAITDDGTLTIVPVGP